MDWSNELIIRFLQLYKGYDIIWNPNHPEHKNKSCVMDAWEQLSRGMGTEVTVSELKKKKDALMATYRNLEKKVQAAKETGDNYKPSWFCYNLMNRFLHNIYRPRGVLENYVEEPKFTFENSNFEYEDFELPTEDIFTEQKPVIDTKKRKIDCEDDIHPEQDVNQLSQSTHSTILPTNSITNVQKKEPDELSLYGELLVTKLRKFDHTNRLIICNKIDNLIFETELKLLTESKDSHQDPLAHDLPTTSRNGKKSLKSSSSHSSPLHSDFSEHPQSE